MKNIIKTLAVMAMSITLVGLTACGEKPEQDLYAFQYDGQTVAASATVKYVPTMTEIRNDWASVEFYMENKSDEDLSTVMTVERVSGPAELDNLSICFGESCMTGVCPWVSDAFTLVPGVNTNMKVVLDYTPSVITGTSVYRITIGKGSSMEHPREMLIDITGE